MNGGHQTFNDIKVVIDDLDQGCQTVGSAASVADNLHVGRVCIFVDAHDEHWSISGWCRNDDFLGATLKIRQMTLPFHTQKNQDLETYLEMSRGLLGGGEDTSGLHNVVGTSRSPRNSSRIPLTEDSNLLAIDLQLVAFNAHFTLITSVGGVILEHVDHVVQGNEGIVDCYHVDILVQSGTEDQAANTTETVDSNFDHFEGLMNVEVVIESVIRQKKLSKEM